MTLAGWVWIVAQLVFWVAAMAVTVAALCAVVVGPLVVLYLALRHWRIA